MPIKVNDLRIKNEFRSESVDWLLANVGDKITIELDLSFSEYAISSVDNPYTYNSTNGYLGTGWVIDPRSQFESFKIGDSVSVDNYILNTNIGTYTIIDKLSASEIRLSAALPFVNNTIATNDTISIIKPITAVRYKYNFVENDDQPTFNSKVDGTEQLMFANGLDASDTVTIVPLSFLGATTYQIGSATIQGDGLIPAFGSTVYQSKFKIVHETYITPFILAEQLSNIENNVAPDYFFNQKCLKAIFDFDGQYLLTDPNRLQTLEVTEIDGNSGWFNENFNTGVTNYVVSGVVFKRPDTSVIPAIELSATSETTVEITIQNVTDTPFVNLGTQFTINFCRIPFDQSEYINNTKNLQQNFLFDRGFNTVGSAPINGDQFGTDYQVLKTIQATFVSSSEILITAQIDMDSDVVSTLNASDERRYLLWVAVQDSTLATNVADKVALKVDAQEFYEDASDPTMIILNNKYLRHPSSDRATEGVNNVSVFPEDELVAYTQFYIDKNGRLTDEIILQRITGKIKAKNSVTLEEFDLDTFSFDMSNLPFINGNQFVSYTLDRPYHIPTTEIRKKIQIVRRTDLDGGDLYYYDFILPELIRWEYWVALTTANGDFFDTLEPNNGWNQFWHRYTTVANWGIYYECEVRATKNGENQTYTFENQIESSDYDTNPDWNPNTIKSYKDSDNTYLFDGLTKYILGYEETRVEAEFTLTTGVPILANIYVVFGIEVYEQGGISGRRRMSSVWASDSDTWFKSVDGSNKTKLTLTGSTIKAEALVDITKIPLNVNQFKITARLYDLTPQVGKQFQDDADFEFQDGDNYEFQD